jgi:hypothetical protein
MAIGSNGWEDIAYLIGGFIRHHEQLEEANQGKQATLSRKGSHNASAV